MEKLLQSWNECEKEVFAKVQGEIVKNPLINISFNEISKDI